MRHILTDLRGNPIYTSFGSWRGNHHLGQGGRLSTASTSSSNGRNSPHHNPNCLLFMHVTTTSWADVIRRVQSHPQEVLYVDDNGNTPLHRACQLDPPLEVVTVLKDAVELSTPSRFSVALSVTGIVAFELAVLKANTCTARIFLRNINGLTRPKSLNSSISVPLACKNNTNTTTPK